MLTPRDLSRAGWCQRLGQPGNSTVVVDGEVVPQSKITGVLTRLPCVFQEELPHIVPEDRAYVAAEMNAFLTFWLTSLTCKVINPPTPGCIAGPSWRPEEWTQRAARAGLEVESLPAGKAPEQESVTTVTVAGGQSFGDADPLLHAQAKRLASLAGVELLSVQFSGPRYLGVHLFPDLSHGDIAAAVLQIFEPVAQVVP